MYTDRQHKNKVGNKIPRQIESGTRQRVKIKDGRENEFHSKISRFSNNQSCSILNSPKILQAAWDWNCSGQNDDYDFWIPFQIPKEYNYESSSWEVLHISKLKKKSKSCSDHVTFMGGGGRYNRYRNGHLEETKNNIMMDGNQVCMAAMKDFDQEMADKSSYAPTVDKSVSKKPLDIRLQSNGEITEKNSNLKNPALDKRSEDTYRKEGAELARHLDINPADDSKISFYEYLKSHQDIVNDDTLKELFTD